MSDSLESFDYDSYVSSFSHLCDKIPSKSNLREGGVLLVHRLRAQSAQAWWQEPDTVATLHLQS